MGFVAIASGILYTLLHYLWLRKMTSDKEVDLTLGKTHLCFAILLNYFFAAESGESEKLKPDEPKYKDQSTMVSFERLSLMIEYNQIGSLTSLGRRGEISHSTGRSGSDNIRRGSYTIGMPNKGSASKVDLLKSALEVNHSRSSNPQLKHSSGHLNRQFKDAKALSTPKLQQRSTSLSPVVDKMEESLIPKEVDELLYDRAKTEQTGVSSKQESKKEEKE